MADEPSFGGFANGDSADTFAKVISKIKQDMAAIEASAKNIEASLGKASKAKMGGGSQFGAQNSGGSTGFSKSAGGTSALGAISSQLGGRPGWGTAAMGGFGAIAGGMGAGGQGALAGGIAAAGLPDLILRPERAMNMEAARFGIAQSTGDFDSFNRIMAGAKNDFNVQNEQAFMNTMVYGTQRAGMVGLNGGGTVGERRAAAQIGGYSTLAGMAGIDQSAVTGMMKTSLASETYYSAMASGIQTRNPVTGETIGVEGQVNQLWKRAGISKGASTEDALAQLDINYAEGSSGRRELLNTYGGNEDMVDTVIEGLKIRARTGEDLKEGQVQDQMKDVGSRGGLGTSKTEAMEETRRLEGDKMEMGAEYLDDATKGIAMAAEQIDKAVQSLTDLEGPLRTMVGAYTTMANALSVAETELPTATKNLTSFFSGLPGVLMTMLAGKGLLGGGGGSLLRTGASLLGRGALAAAGTTVGAVALGGAAAAAGVAAVGMAGSYVVHNYTDYDKNREDGSQSAAAIANNAGRRNAMGSAPTSGYGGGYAKGDWFVEADQDTRIHYGEMVIPNRIATAVRRELDAGKPPEEVRRKNGGNHGETTVNIYLTVQSASDQEAIYFANKVKKIIDGDRELMAIGAGRFA